MSDPTYKLSECGKKLIETKIEAEEFIITNLIERKTMIESHIVKLKAEIEGMSEKIAKAEELGYTE